MSQAGGSVQSSAAGYRAPSLVMPTLLLASCFAKCCFVYKGLFPWSLSLAIIIL